MEKNLPLKDLKVLELTRVIVGPGVARFLGSGGATVVHVESRKRLDFMRTSYPYKDNEPGINLDLAIVKRGQVSTDRNLLDQAAIHAHVGQHHPVGDVGASALFESHPPPDEILGPLDARVRLGDETHR